MTSGGVSVLLLLVVVLAGMPDDAAASRIRTYTASRHDRFTGFPTTPVWNPAAWYDSPRFSGIGWQANYIQKQFALVSPRHAVFATHFLPPIGAVIRFLNRDGMVLERTVSARQSVKNSENKNSDLTLLTLSAPFTEADKVDFFPYLALPSEADYFNTSLVAFGWNAKAGRGRLTAMDDYERAGLNLTRLLRFDYRIQFGGQDDSYLEGNDSGSPTFAMVDGQPALVGTHTAIAYDTQFKANFDTFVPHYVDELNAFMAADGYQLTPSHPSPVTFTITATAEPEVFLQERDALYVFEVTNTSAHDAADVEVKLRFGQGGVPGTLAAPGWTVTTGGTGERILTRAALAAAESATITAGWAQPAGVDFLEVYLDAKADTLAEQSCDFTRLLAVPYEVWAADLTHPAPDDDDDGDGMVNLLEYAHNGTAPSLLRAADGATATYSFPVRQHAAGLGLTYVVEFSDTLADGSWSDEAPPGTTVTDRAMDPFKVGFSLRRVEFPTDVPRRFCRVRVVLTDLPEA